MSPQGRYTKCDVSPLHKHGHGTFCKFLISVPKGLIRVYALVVDGSARYIGECEDLGKRFKMGYGNISPRNCYKGGQQTNCKINRRVLDVSKAGGRVDPYFHPTPQRKPVEKQLVSTYAPPWND
ncbi:MAG: GIY-YIG nuclease family protein [Thermomicrobiales bacterium]